VAREQLLRPDVRCPRPGCGAPPRIRATPTMVALAGRLQPDAKLQTYQCTCGMVYDVTAAAYQSAA
jgi:hypothetical protein